MESGRPEHDVLTDEDGVHKVLDTGAGVARGPVGAGVRVHLLGDLLIEGQSWELALLCSVRAFRSPPALPPNCENALWWERARPFAGRRPRC
jgi:hypothetical protein